MPYIVEAWMEQGAARVRLRDPASGEVRLDWMGQRDDDRGMADRGLHRLMRDLIRVACMERMSLLARSLDPLAGHECVNCWGCASADVTAPAAAAAAERRAR